MARRGEFLRACLLVCIGILGWGARPSFAQTGTMPEETTVPVTMPVTMPTTESNAATTGAPPAITTGATPMATTGALPTANPGTMAPPTTSSGVQPTSASDDGMLSPEERRQYEERIGVFDYYHREYEGYDGWYNNMAHPDWGGSELPLTRRLPVAYADGVYMMAGKDRPNPIDVSEATMRGDTGLPSFLNRTAFMTFFGQQVVEEILDAQGAGCPPEYENIEIPEGHEYKDMTKNNSHGPVDFIPFLRTRYSFNTGYSPNVPREQLNEITPWIDGGLVYGTTKAWADALRSFEGGRLADNSKNNPNEKGFPEENTIGLPMANVPPPAEAKDHVLRNVRRFFKLGNPRGNENPFLLTFGILWFRWHNYWADKIYNSTMDHRYEWNDERIFNEARKWVIATYQKIVLYDWLPAFLNMDAEEIETNRYTGYKSYVHPGITHEFQSAAMRFGHTLVPPGVYRRDAQCNFLNTSLESSNIPGTQFSPVHGVRTCNSFWNPQLPIREYDIENFLMGMASQITEREDNIITIDLQRRVFGPLDFSRRDLMAQNIQRGRDHGLPDYNTAREALGLTPVKSFREINNATIFENDQTGIDPSILDNLEEVCKGDLSKIDIWPGGLLETTANGPGPLFRKIILDQFLRTRDGDRFWFENEQNGLFTKEQIEYIRNNISVYDVLILATNIKPGEVQQDVFHYMAGDPCWDMHPNENHSINEKDMEECTMLYTFDYFTGSEISYAVSYFALGLFCLGVVLTLFICARRRTKATEEVRKATRTKTRKGKGPESLQKFPALEWCGSKSGTRPIQVALGPGKAIKVMNERGNKLYRTIDLAHHQKITLCVSPDGNRRYVLLHMEREYDLVLKFDDIESRTEYISELQSFLGSGEVGLGQERQETREKDLLRMAITKEHRQKTLERFFRVAFAQAFNESVDSTDLSELERTDAKDVLNNELTKTEFAEMLSMPPDSIFVEQMFDLVDKDQSGALSFREFLDVIVIFAKGKPEEKLKLMFNMYDVDRSGHLSRDEFMTMLKSMMETVSASLEQKQLEDVISSMFKAAGFENKEELSLEDFITLMGDHKEELSQAALQLQGADVPEAAQPTPDRGATVIRRENAPSRARKTIVRAYAEKDSDRPRTAKNRYQSRVIRVETKKATYTENRTQQKLNRFLRYIENNRLQLFYLVLYNLVLAGIFIERAYYYSVEREHGGLRRIAGYGVTVTRGAASAMMFTYSTLLATMCRNTITFLRGTFLHRYVPFDSALFFHKFVAMLALFWSVVHTIGHSLNFYHIATQTASDLSCLFRDFFNGSHELPKFHFWAYRTITGFTGILLVMVCAIMYTFAFSYARRKVFNLFWLTHNLYAFYFFLMVMHGSGNLVQPPFFYYFFLPPVIVFTLDKLVSVSRKKAEITVVKAELLPSNVTMLEFKRPTTFEYKSGQWVRIACKTLNSSEYHPFTLSSAPHEENLSLHIRAVGPWTINLRHTFDPNVVREQPYPKLFLDGPYGEGHQDWYQFEVSVLVGGGIGVTPFASILKDLVYRSSQGQKFTCKKVYFIWVTRTQKQFEWLTDIIREVEDKDVNDLVSVHIFITQFFQKFDLRTTMLYICERHFQKISDRSLFTGLRSITHFGRPQFEPFLQSLQEEHPSVGKIGVFSCGPPGMTNNVEKACSELNKYDGAAFIHHFENF
ncbi:dual oxidase 2-like isoform X3 [Acanthaster planci]|uniref:NAD(P)H oxidase (H2O2-forming) n=1 Tax=Acanthaster planci TaxID=133434 RepID=A0A8B7YMZ8_ACAPL|nr:dual oxidase 2-like isoform X3 [Acanthaster planci]